MEKSAARRRRGVVGVAALVALVVTGCSVVQESAASDGRPQVDAAAQADLAGPSTPSPAPEPRLSDVAPGTVIATGSFDDRGTTGRIEIRANGSDRGFDVALTGVNPVPPAGASLELNALPATAAEEQLRSGFSYYRYDPLHSSADQTYSTPGAGYGGFETNDPSYMRTAVIWAAEPGTEFLFGSIVATAPLTWDLPDMNPGLEVVDRGAADGALGRVTVAPDGRPASYRVAWGDTPDGITGRFGITMGDLEWLNPDRHSTRLVLADITLNLSRESRGLRQ